MDLNFIGKGVTFIYLYGKIKKAVACILNNIIPTSVMKRRINNKKEKIQKLY